MIVTHLFFHLSITKRHRKNRIAFLHNPDGSHSTTQEQLADTLLVSFHNIYNVHNATTNDTNFFQQHLIAAPDGNPTTTITNEPIAAPDAPDDSIFDYTNSIPDVNELHSIVKEMRNNASPGPDGLNALFYKSAWSWISQDVCNLVTEFYSTASLHRV